MSTPRRHRETYPPPVAQATEQSGGFEDERPVT